MKELLKKHNSFDIKIILLITSLAFGGIGGSLQIIRIISIFLFPSFIIHIVRCSYYIKNYLFIISLFLLYSLFSLLWTANVKEGVTEMLYFGIHFLIYLELVVFSKFAINPLSSITSGWLFAVFLTLTIAIWEILTDNHLSISFQKSDLQMNIGGEVLRRQFASVTFGNYNKYVSFLCAAFPFLLYRMMSIVKIKLNNILTILCILLSVVCILYNASRGGLIAICIMFLTYIVSQKITKKTAILYFFFIGAGTLFIYCFGDAMFSVIIARTSDGGLFEGSSRFRIWAGAWEAFKSSYGLGTGIGSVNSSMLKFLGYSVPPHNMFLEILLEFGIIPFLLFLSYGINLIRASKRLIPIRKRVMYIALISFPVLSIINSGYLHDPYIYVYMASLTCFVSTKENNSNIIQHDENCIYT